MSTTLSPESREQLRQERYLVIAEVSRRMNRRRVAERLANMSFLAIDDTDWEPPRFSLEQLD